MISVVTHQFYVRLPFLRFVYCQRIEWGIKAMRWMLEWHVHLEQLTSSMDSITAYISSKVQMKVR